MSPHFRGTGSRRAAQAVTGVALVGLLAGCAGGNSAKKGPGIDDQRYVSGDGSSKVVQVGDRKPAPELQGTTIDGASLSTADFTNKVIVVNFWASWCSPCRAEAPTLEKLYQKTKSSGVEFVGIDIKDSKDNARAFARSFKITYPSLYDHAGQIALKFREVPPNAVPSTLVIDRNGKIAARVIGSVTYSKLNHLITKVVAE